jgi:hypothetical protein
VLTGIELRVFYSEEEIIGTKLYRGPTADEQVTAQRMRSASR